MQQDGKITILDSTVSTGFNQWIAQQRDRGKSSEKILKKVMKFWLDFAWNKIKKGDKAAIRSYLMTKVVKRHNKKKGRLSEVESEYKGTIADRIVRKLNYKGAREKKGAAYFEVVRNFVGAREFSHNHHRAGLYPAYKFIKSRAMDTSGPKYRRNPSGSAEGKFLDSLAELLVENFASAHPVPGRPAPLGIAGLSGDAFAKSMPEVAILFSKFALEDAVKQGKDAGFKVVEFN